MNMKCRFCNEELPEKGCFCPVCGKDQREQLPVLTDADIRSQAEEEAEMPSQEEAAPSKELQKAKRIAAITGCVAGLAILATVLFVGIRGGWDVKSWFDWLKPRENTVAYKDSYTVEADKAQKKKDVVVATLGEGELTNGQLQIYYWSGFYDFISNYYAYLSYFGLDYAKPLDSQMYTETQSWQQYFLESALQSWQANQALYAQAKANGFVLPQQEQEELDNMRQTLETTAAEKEYASAEEMVQESFGPGCTVDDYIAYMEVYIYAYSYFEQLYEAIDPTDAQVEAYFTANEAKLKESGITKDTGNYVDVRHILVKIDKFAAQTADGETQSTTKTYTDEEWAACYAAAEEILNQWLADPTEDHFAQLANEHSDDNNGNVTNGGIYTRITKQTNFVEPFLSWCMDESRQVGDYGIVRTDYGYHVMYFSHSEPVWFAESRDALISEESQKIVNEALDADEPEFDYKKMVLGDISLS